MIEKLPGYVEAQKLGYTLMSYSGNMRSANYAKGDLFLKVWSGVVEGDVAELSAMWSIVRLSTLEFEFPHKRFEYFEGELLKAINALPPH